MDRLKASRELYPTDYYSSQAYFDDPDLSIKLIFSDTCGVLSEDGSLWFIRRAFQMEVRTLGDRNEDDQRTVNELFTFEINTKRNGTKVLASQYSHGLSGKTQWTSGLLLRWFHQLYSPTQLCGRWDDKSGNRYRFVLSLNDWMWDMATCCFLVLRWKLLSFFKWLLFLECSKLHLRQQQLYQ